MARTFAQLQALSDTDLIRAYDDAAIHTDPGLSFYRDELMRRDLGRQNRRIERLTLWVTWMTAVILGLTVVNVAVVLITLRR